MHGRNVLQEGGLVQAPSLAVRTAVALRRIAADVLATKIEFHIRRRVDAHHRMVERMFAGGEVIVVAILTNVKLAAGQAAIASAREGLLGASLAHDALVTVHRDSPASNWPGSDHQLPVASSPASSSIVFKSTNPRNVHSIKYLKTEKGNEQGWLDLLSGAHLMEK